MGIFAGFGFLSKYLFIYLGLVIDLDTCVGCQACVVNCKEWNTSGYGAPLSDENAYGADPNGAWLNRVHAYEEFNNENVKTVHFPKSCLHCEDAPCVTVCPTGASYKRAEDGIVLVNEDWCIGCGLCAWSCPYGAREMDPTENVMKKCTLCVDRIYNDNIPEVDRVPACVKTCPTSARHFGDLGDPDSDVSKLVAKRNGFDLLPEQETKPVNKYLPPQSSCNSEENEFSLVKMADSSSPKGFWKWMDDTLEKLG